MNFNLLSPVHIDKLGHPIEEIRTRALHSVWSKFDLDLVDDSNIENIKLLLVKLIEWFNFETHPHEEKVFRLILRILGRIYSEATAKEINVQQVSEKIDKIKNDLDGKFLILINEIQEYLRKIEESLLQSNPDIPEHYTISRKSEDVTGARVEINHSNCTTSIKQTLPSTLYWNNDSERDLQRKDSNGFNSYEHRLKSDKFKNEKLFQCEEKKVRGKIIQKNPTTELEYFPWQLLVINDSSILSSIYDGLRYLDNIDSILHSCQFYTDILLRDFPTEIFIQRPLLVQTFFELLHTEESIIYVQAAKCLCATVKHLKNRFLVLINASLIHFNPCYRGVPFSKVCNYEENNFERDDHKKFINANNYSSDSEMELEKEEEVLCMKSQQYSFSEFCFSVLSQAIPHLLKEKSLEEYNITFELILETFSCLAMNFQPVVLWNKRIKDRIYKIFNAFYSPLKYHKTGNSIIHSIIVYSIVNFLNLLQLPGEESQEILPHVIRLELVECISDYIFILMHPNLYSKIKILVEKSLGQRERKILNAHEASLELCYSMKAAVEILKRDNNLNTKMERLECIQKALPCLEFHRNYQFIQEFVTICLFKWSEKQLKLEEFNLRKTILLKLLSNKDGEIRLTTYKDLHTYVMRYLGVNEKSEPKYQYPGDKFGFLFDSDVLIEMICYGINSDQTEIQNICSEIFIHILKGRIFFSGSSWKNLIEALGPCLCLLQCFADKSTALGRCIFKMFDPDISKTISLASLELLRGNLRLLFSKNNLIREEAILRLYWLLTKEDPNKIKLPRLNLLRGINLSSICSSVEPEELSRMNQSFFSADSLNNVMEMLTADKIEPSVRRSALTQLSVMLEDSHLHRIFLDQGGLHIILDIFENCLIEKEYQHYPDSAIPIMKILKHICLDNPSVRIELSQNIYLHYCILRGLLLFNSDRQSRQQGVELLCLLLYNECIINVKNERAIMSKISVPQILASKIHIPFVTHIHWKYSQHAEPSNRETVMLREKSASLIRIYWNVQWFGGISEVLSLKNSDLNENIFSPGLPNDMKLKIEDLASLRKFSIPYGVRQTLFDIQNAHSHEVVVSSLHNLKSYLILYDLERSFDEGNNLNNSNQTTASLIDMKWANTLQKFLLSTPSCKDDEVLLYQVLNCVRLILRTFKSEELFIWVEKLLTNEVEILPNILKSHSSSTNSTRIDVIRSVTGLIKDTVTRTTEYLPSKWLFYINLIIKQLKLNKKHEFRDVAHVDCLLSVLADVTGRSTEKNIHKSEIYKEIISGTMEIIVAFHCTKYSQNSFFGTNIIKNSLIVLNNILNDTQAIVEGWECLWNHALSDVTWHTEQPDYCWLLSFWLSRDPVVRALAIQLTVGFSLTCQSCELLLEKLHIEFEYLWNEGFRILFDDNECNLVREKAALLLSNLSYHGSVTTAKEYLKYLMEIKFYQKLCELFERIQMDEKENEAVIDFKIKLCSGEFEDGFNVIIPTTIPSFVSAVCNLIINVMFLNAEESSEIILSTGLLDELKKVFYDAPELCCKYKENECFTSTELLKMYKNCSKIVMKCMTFNFGAYSSVRQDQQFINAIFNLMNYSLYDENSQIILDERNQFWCQILDTLSLILSRPLATNPDTQHLQKDGFKALNCAMTENGTDFFISTLYIAASSNSCELRMRCLRFLANFFGFESHKSSEFTITDIFDRHILLNAVKHAEKLGWKGLSFNVKLDLNFGKRISNILLQTYRIIDHNSELKTFITDALGSLLSVCENAQNYCLDEGLANDINESLKTFFIKLTMERVDSLKKSANRKKVDTILLEMENSYRLLTNFLIGNEKVKSHVAGTGLASLMHKLWYWCTTKKSLLIAALKLLCTFTLNSDSACRSLALDKSWSVIGLSKHHGAVTLIQTVILHIEKEIEYNSKNQNVEVLQLLFQLLENSCRATECRSIIAKGTFIRCFGNYFHEFLNKKRSQSDFIVHLWLNFFIIFTSYQEGQLALPKNQDALDAVTEMAFTTNCGHRKKALKVLRNISFHQLNRAQLLGHYKFLTTMIDSIKSGENEEIELALHGIWGLICNSQKGKIIVRNTGLEDILKNVSKKLKMSGDNNGLSVVNTVAQILMNK